MKRVFVIALIFILLIPAGQAYAAIKTHPIEQFTRSMSALYIAFASCSFVSPHGNQSPIDRIKTYLSGLYPTGIPYWAMPPIHNQITDEDICNFLIYDRIISYRQASQNFAKVYPEVNIPPVFVSSKPRVYYTITEDFLKFGQDGTLEVKSDKRTLSVDLLE